MSQASSSGTATSRSSLASSVRIRPGRDQAPSTSSLAATSATSCSSRTSPTISSTRSSSVTSPAMESNSSISTAIWRPPARRSSISSSSGIESGQTIAGRRKAPMRVVARSAYGTARTALMWATPRTSTSVWPSVSSLVSSTGKRGVAADAGALDELGDGVGGVQRDHPRAGGHGVPGAAVAERERALDQLGGVQGERAPLGGVLDERGELLGAAGRGELLLGLDADAAQDAVGGAVEEPDRPGDGAGEAALEAGDGARGGQRPGDREVLGHELPEDHRHDRGGDEADRDRRRRDGGLREPEVAQTGADEGGDGGARRGSRSRGW